MRRYDATVPVKDANDKTRYRDVGVVFENQSQVTGETYLRVQLDFPMWVSELVCFQAQPRSDADDHPAAKAG
ncbi:MAG: hypothetical protein OXC63_08330 [Aestuariivita sp.]|nr:hypothetical protein [Aestuariivita sp.]MCY4345398.1 hypothetical protein [Aestuariivita sp.]